MTVRPPGVTGATATKAKTEKQAKADDLGPGSLAGNLTKDPELRFTPNGLAVCDLRVAVADRRRDERTGAWMESPTEYFTVQVWRALAEHCAECLQKGHRIIAEGVWKSDQWTDGQGEKQQRIFLAATEVGASLLFTDVRIMAVERSKRS